jgi:LasA protease
MKLRQQRRELIGLIPFLLLPLILALACNFPSGSSVSEGSLSMRALEQTATSQARENPASIATELPGQPPGSDVATPTPAPAEIYIEPPPENLPLGAIYEYAIQPGDTLPALAARFAIEPHEIISNQLMPDQGFLPQEYTLVIPNRLTKVTPGLWLIPDQELVNSPTAIDFDLDAYVMEAGGYLSAYQENLADGRQISGIEIIRQVSTELSVNPRLLLAILETRSGWVFGQPQAGQDLRYPFGFAIPDRRGLYQETMITATQLNVAYYGWRAGSFTEIRYSDGTRARLNPTLNAGSVAIQHLFAMFHRLVPWEDALYHPNGFPYRYEAWFGNPWERAALAGPIFPPDLEQPVLELPFLPGEQWSLTAGPHPSWNAGTPRGALDFSPATGEPICVVSSTWARAVAPGVIARAADNAVILDLDGDGYEQTGWTIFYFHLAQRDLISQGTFVNLDDPLGHPSCEGGRATGKHVHLARKYNGEWLAADGPLPFILSGYQAFADTRNYHGTLVRGDQIVSSDPGGSRSSSIRR